MLQNTKETIIGWIGAADQPATGPRSKAVSGPGRLLLNPSDICIWREINGKYWYWGFWCEIESKHTLYMRFESEAEIEGSYHVYSVNWVLLVVVCCCVNMGQNSVIQWGWRTMQLQGSSCRTARVVSESIGNSEKFNSKYK